jgi:hypothetical protein
MTSPVVYIAVPWSCVNEDCSIPAATVPVGDRLAPNSPYYCPHDMPYPGARGDWN